MTDKGAYAIAIAIVLLAFSVFWTGRYQVFSTQSSAVDVYDAVTGKTVRCRANEEGEYFCP